MQWKPHVTVAAIVRSGDKFLLVEESINGLIVINQPAGHLEKGESLTEAIKREVLEETARQFQPEFLVGTYLYQGTNDNTTWLRFCFYGSCSDRDDQRELDTGIIRNVWMTYAELEAARSRLRSPMVLKCLDDYLAGESCPLSVLYHQLPDHS